MPTFDAAYFRRQYADRGWRRAGEKPILDRSRLRWLRARVPTGVLLEIGAGLGSFSRLAAQRYTVVGSDLDPAVVRAAFTGTPVHGASMSAYALPFRNASIDIVCIFDVLEHLADPPACLREIARVLRPGGLFFCSMPNPEGLGARLKGRASFIYRDATHCSVLTSEAWLAMLHAHGLRTVAVGTDTLWDPPYVRWLPARLQWAACLAASQLAWLVAPAFHWRHGENFVFLGERT